MSIGDSLVAQKICDEMQAGGSVTNEQRKSLVLTTVSKIKL